MSKNSYFQINSYHAIVKSQGNRSYSPSRANQNASPSKEGNLITDDNVTPEVTSPSIDSLDVTENDEAAQSRSYLR